MIICLQKSADGGVIYALSCTRKSIWLMLARSHINQWFRLLRAGLIGAPDAATRIAEESVRLAIWILTTKEMICPPTK